MQWKCTLRAEKQFAYVTKLIVAHINWRDVYTSHHDYRNSMLMPQVLEREYSRRITRSSYFIRTVVYMDRVKIKSWKHCICNTNSRIPGIFAVRKQWLKISHDYSISSLVINQEMQFPIKLLNIDLAQRKERKRAAAKSNAILFPF